MELLLAPLAPSLAFAWARASGGSLLPVLLLYYALPLPLYLLGSRLPLPLGGGRLKGVSPEALALLLPYLLYWVGAGRLWPFWAAYAGFLKGPGLAVPLTVLVLWPIGLHLPPLLGAALVLVGSVGAERAVRWLRGIS